MTDLINCFNIILKERLWDDDQSVFQKNVKKWALKNHPDKNPNANLELVKQVFTCREKHSELKILKPYLTLLNDKDKEITFLKTKVQDYQNKLYECDSIWKEKNFLQDELNKCRQFFSPNFQSNYDTLQRNINECKSHYQNLENMYTQLQKQYTDVSNRLNSYEKFTKYR